MENNKEYIIKAPDNEFILSFIHSVHHTPVYEIFNIRTDNKLILKETRFFSLGVGLPFTEEGGKFINENGEFVLKFSREFDKLNLRISPIPQHAIEVGNMTYSFLEFANPEDQVEIKAADKWVFIKK